MFPPDTALSPLQELNFRRHQILQLDNTDSISVFTVVCLYLKRHLHPRVPETLDVQIN